MYGFTPFAAVPFASLNTAFGAVAESVALSESQTGNIGYGLSVAESVALTQTQDISAAFVGAQAESLTLTLTQPGVVN